VAAALAILGEVEAMTESGAIAPTTLCIGLHAGKVVTGTVGPKERKGYTIIGDVVNVASRLEQLNKQFGSQLLVSSAVRDALGDAWAMIHLGPVEIRGKAASVDVYQVA